VEAQEEEIDATHEHYGEMVLDLQAELEFWKNKCKMMGAEDTPEHNF
jgi:hypothetical protein